MIDCFLLPAPYPLPVCVCIISPPTLSIIIWWLDILLLCGCILSTQSFAMQLEARIRLR